MVKGIEIFKEHFSEFTDRYALIGGTACDLAMNRMGLEFRATKDLDIVLCIEAFDAEFAKAFWRFVTAGGYLDRGQGDANKQYYRFQHPTHPEYPFMLELFSRVPDALLIVEGCHLTPIPVGDDISSLSAILLDDEHYRFLMAGRMNVDGLSVVGPEHLVPLKAKAWLDLTDRKANGEAIDSKSIRKHKNDVFRLYKIIDPAFEALIPESIKDEMRAFLARQEREPTDLKVLGLETTLQAVLADYRSIYKLDR